MPPIAAFRSASSKTMQAPFAAELHQLALHLRAAHRADVLADRGRAGEADDQGRWWVGDDGPKRDVLAGDQAVDPGREASLVHQLDHAQHAERVRRGGLTITVLPMANAGPILPAMLVIGTLGEYGSQITPTGKRCNCGDPLGPALMVGMTAGSGNVVCIAPVAQRRNRAVAGKNGWT